MPRQIILFLVLALLLAAGKLPGQRWYLSLPPGEADQAEKLLHDFEPKPLRAAADTLLLVTAEHRDSLARRLLRHLRDRSHLAASLDSLRCDSSGCQAQLYPGPSLYWVRLRPAYSENEWLAQSGFRERLFTGTPLRYDELIRRQEALLRLAENNGYPFAEVRLDSLSLDPDGGVSAILLLERNRYVEFRGLKLQGDVSLPKAYLPAYLGIRPGAPYHAERILRIRDRLRELPFLESSANPVVSFAGNQATVNLFLQKKKASRFDFILGLLPQPNATDGRLLITGSLNAAFQNALGLGEHFSIDLERLRPSTQELEAAAGVPYVFGLPVGLDGRISIFRRDSSWVDANSELGVQYLFEGGAFLKLLWETRRSSLQAVDTVSIINTRRLPANLDLRQTGFGLESNLLRLDYRYNPRRGWSAGIKGVAGFTTVRPNSRIVTLQDPADPDFDFASLYDTLRLRNTRWRLELRAEAYLPLFQRSTLKMALRSSSIISGKPVYNNEQYRLGGNRLLRGFNEESLFATRFAVATLEYRLLLGPNSFLAAFTDYGYLENITNRVRLFQRPWGVGAGLNFETPAGIFGISMAVGRFDAGLPFDLRATKFHLGYVSLF